MPHQYPCGQVVRMRGGTCLYLGCFAQQTDDLFCADHAPRYPASPSAAPETAAVIAKRIADRKAKAPKRPNLADWEKAVLAEAQRDPRHLNGDTSTSRQLRVTKATDMQIRATRWLWEDAYAHWIGMGSLVGLAGREGVGKSTWCAYLTAKVTRGELPGDFYGTPKSVIICTTEDDWNATLKPRLMAAGADMDRVFRVDSVDADGLAGIVTLPNDLHGMEATIREHDVALVILDPLLTFVNAKLDTHKDAEVRRALEPVVRMAHDTTASVIGLIHVNKTSDGDLMNRVMGSRAIGAVARGVLFCGSYKPVEDMAQEDDSPFASPNPEQKRARFVFGQIKNNLQAKVMKSVEYHIGGRTVGYDQEAQKDIEGSYLVLDKEHPENVEDIVLEQEKRAKATKTGSSKAEGWLVAYLTGKGEVPSQEVLRSAKGAGLSKNQVHAGRKKLGDQVVVRRAAQMHSGTTWELLPE
jgi:hypothetical protein